MMTRRCAPYINGADIAQDDDLQRTLRLYICAHKMMPMPAKARFITDGNVLSMRRRRAAWSAECIGAISTVDMPFVSINMEPCLQHGDIVSASNLGNIKAKSFLNRYI